MRILLKETSVWHILDAFKRSRVESLVVSYRLCCCVINFHIVFLQQSSFLLLVWVLRTPSTVRENRLPGTTVVLLILGTSVTIEDGHTAVACGKLVDSVLLNKRLGHRSYLLAYYEAVNTLQRKQIQQKIQVDYYLVVVRTEVIPKIQGSILSASVRLFSSMILSVE